jgi:flavin-dependent dehydrogenase
MEGSQAHRVVVVGGGFGGLQAAMHLARGPVELTLVDRRNFHLFQPLTYQVATGALSPGEVCYPPARDLQAAAQRPRRAGRRHRLRPRRARAARDPRAPVTGASSRFPTTR